MNCLEESIRQVLDDYSVKLPDEAIADIIQAIDGCREYESYSHGGYNPQAEEVKRLETALKREREKQICPECNGKGCIDSGFGVRYAISSCCRCGGAGYLYHD